MPTQLSGQFDLSTATETVPFTSNDVASFTDANHTDTAAAFTATIDWGDGITTAGTVVGANGSFTIQGSHTYADDGFFNPVATVVRTADNSTLVMPGGINVADTDNITGHGEPTIVANPNQALTNVTVGTFTDTNTTNDPSDFNVSIDWGDGTVTSGTLTGSNGSFAVTGSHTYTTAGNFTISTFMTDDSGQEDAAFGSAFTQAAIGFGGSVTLQSATETVPAGGTVATFVDNAGLPSTDYTATIDWGDGVTTTGTVSGSNGSFTVDGAHTYADEGLDTAVVTVTRTTDNAHITMSGTVAVADNDVLSASPTTLHGDPNVALSNVTVANFTDTNHVNGAGDFVATIDWGDGVTTTGTVTGSNGAFAVNGSHTYTQNGQDIITVTVTEEPDNPQSFAFASTQSTALIGLAPVSASDLSPTEGTAVAAGTQVATFSDSNSSDTAASFTATIDWGDGTTTAGTVSGSNGSFTVSSATDHTYVDEAFDAITTTLTRTADHVTATAVGRAEVGEADVLSAHADNISGNAGQPFNNVQVATFTTTYTANVASDFQAFIDWGDGATTAGTVSGSNGSFAVTGSHTYTNGGHDTLTVTVADGDGTASATASGTASINLAGQMVLTSATEGTALPNTTPVATFSDTTLTDTAADFTATIDWGDGVTTAGTVVGAAGSFTVDGGHTYTDEGSSFGNDFATVTLTRTADNSFSTVTGAVVVGEGDVLTGSGTAISANANQAFNGTVATFSDVDTVTAANDFLATIDWGDGQTTSGTVSGANGSFTVNGTHTYTTAGDFTIQVHGADDDPGTATFDTTSSAHVVFPIVGHMVLTSASEHVALANTTAVATFTDGNMSDTAGDFTATIDWGDGVTTNGTVVGSNGSFTVDGGHTYADEGTDNAVVTLTHTSDHSQATANGPVTVAEHDVLTGQDMHAAIVVNQPFSGVIGHFTDTDHVTPASDFVATIDWGDGTTTSGTVSGSNGAFDVSGTHAYTDVGLHRVEVTLSDDAPGTATATAEAKIVFNHSNGHHANADTADTSALHQSTDGTTDPAGQTLGVIPDNWDMIGVGTFSGPSTDTAINTDALFLSDSGGVVIWQTVNGDLTANQFIGQLPSNYQLAGIDDFNGDGKSDVLWQDDAGHVVMWQMDGTNVVANQQIGQLPTNWHISSTGDVNGDGMSDIILTSDAGDQRVWEMNGTQVIADQPFDPNAPLASHVLDAHAPTMPAAAQAVDTTSILGGLTGTVSALHDPHFLV